MGRPRGIGWRGRWEGISGWGIHVNPWLIHVNVWQKPLQYCKVEFLILSCVCLFFQLAYCIVQFLEKDPSLTEPVSIFSIILKNFRKTTFHGVCKKN